MIGGESEADNKSMLSLKTLYHKGFKVLSITFETTVCPSQ